MDTSGIIERPNCVVEKTVRRAPCGHGTSHKGDVREALIRGLVRLSHMVVGGRVFGEDGLGLESENQIHWIRSSLGTGPYSVCFRNHQLGQSGSSHHRFENTYSDLIFFDCAFRFSYNIRFEKVRILKDL